MTTRLRQIKKWRRWSDYQSSCLILLLIRLLINPLKSESSTKILHIGLKFQIFSLGVLIWWRYLKGATIFRTHFDSLLKIKRHWCLPSKILHFYLVAPSWNWNESYILCKDCKHLLNVRNNTYSARKFFWCYHMRLHSICLCNLNTIIHHILTLFYEAI